MFYCSLEAINTFKNTFKNLKTFKILEYIHWNKKKPLKDPFFFISIKSLNLKKKISLKLVIVRICNKTL